MAKKLCSTCHEERNGGSVTGVVVFTMMEWNNDKAILTYYLLLGCVFDLLLDIGYGFQRNLNM